MEQHGLVVGALPGGFGSRGPLLPGGELAIVDHDRNVAVRARLDRAPARK